MGVFGTEMTTATGTCASCERQEQVGVYHPAPGEVVVYPRCDNLLIVVVAVLGGASSCAD